MISTAHGLADDDERHEHDKIIGPADAFAAEGKVVNRQGDLVADFKGHRREGWQMAAGIGNDESGQAGGQRPDVGGRAKGPRTTGRRIGAEEGRADA